MKSEEYETHPSFVVSKTIYFDPKGQQIYFEPGTIHNAPELICRCYPKTFENKERKEQYEKDLYDYEECTFVNGMPKVPECPSQDSFRIKGMMMFLTGGFYFDNEQAMTPNQYSEFKSKLQDNAEFFTETKQQISNKTNLSKKNIVSRFIKNCSRRI